MLEEIGPVLADHERAGGPGALQFGLHVGALGLERAIVSARHQPDRVLACPFDDVGDEGVPDGNCGPLEISAATVVGSEDGERVELFNPSDCGMGLRGYTMNQDGARIWDGTESDGLPPGGTFTIRGSDYDGAWHATLRGDLRGEGTLELIDPFGNRLDAWSTHGD